MPGYLLFGIALGLVYAPMSTAAMLAMPREKAGIAAGVLAMIRVTAGAVALAVTSAVFQGIQANQLDVHPGDVAGAFATALADSTWVLVGLVAVGAVLDLGARPADRGGAPAAGGAPGAQARAPPPAPLGLRRGERPRLPALNGGVLPNVDEIATVVVCEDDDATRELLCDHLTADRYRALPAPSASDALRLCGYNQPDLMLLDLGLPDAPGSTSCGRSAPPASASTRTFPC